MKQTTIMMVLGMALSATAADAQAVNATNTMTPDEARIAEAQQEVFAAQQNVLDSMKGLCRNREAYLQMFESMDDRDREMLKATCAAPPSKPGKRKR